ncbi:hypothetical protein C8Q79DRAFT_462148 [Trametes meyenii]|nr:hypothetical protein C8Q79DRAFT_462148 [Trametes meyenii]
MSEATGRQSRYLRSTNHRCGRCFAGSTPERKLSSCGGCGRQFYCSRECQRADWQTHKPQCQTEDMIQRALVQLDTTPEGVPLRAGLPDGMSLVTLDAHRDEWVRYHNQNVLIAAVHALRLLEDIHRTRTHFLYVHLAPRPRAEHEGFAGKLFRIEDARAVEWAEAERWPLPWPLLRQETTLTQQEGEAGGLGPVAMAYIDCPNRLPLLPMPMARLPIMEGEVNPQWKEAFTSWVENGVQQRLLDLNRVRRRRRRH